MTRRCLLVSLFLFPVFAHAECGFSRGDGTVTVVVGKDSKCSKEFRAAFRSDMIASVQAMNDADGDRQAARKKTFDDRTARSAKLWALEERAFQSRVPTGRYYGQR